MQMDLWYDVVVQEMAAAHLELSELLEDGEAALASEVTDAETDD